MDGVVRSTVWPLSHIDRRAWDGRVIVRNHGPGTSPAKIPATSPEFFGGDGSTPRRAPSSGVAWERGFAACGSVLALFFPSHPIPDLVRMSAGWGIIARSYEATTVKFLGPGYPTAPVGLRFFGLYLASFFDLTSSGPRSDVGVM